MQKLENVPVGFCKDSFNQIHTITHILTYIKRICVRIEKSLGFKVAAAGVEWES